MGRAKRHLTPECDKGVGTGTIQAIYIRRNNGWRRIGSVCLSCHKLWLGTIATDPTEIARQQTREGQAARDAILRRLNRGHA